MIPDKDRLIEVRENDLLHLLACAMRYNSRLPHGMVPPGIWELLSDEGRQWLRVIGEGLR